MGSIPGMPAEMLAGTEEESSKRFKRMMCIMDSMTDTGTSIAALSISIFTAY